MNLVFADTSFFVCLANADDEFHDLAAEFATQFVGTTVTTEYVLVELGNWFCRAQNRHSFVTLMQQLWDDPKTLIIPASEEVFRRGFDLYQGRPDKEWSMTDCISFVVMEDESITDALTTDHHFEQASFTILLK